MKTIITIIMVSLFSIGVLKAQDIIIKNDKTEIKSKVMEISDTEVKYKRSEMLDGPTYSIKKADVFMIIYQNGQRDIFQAATPPSANNTPTAAAPTPSAVNTVKKLELLKHDKVKSVWAVNDKIRFRYLGENGIKQRVAGIITDIQSDYVVVDDKRYAVSKIVSFPAITNAWGAIAAYLIVGGLAYAIYSDPIVPAAIIGLDLLIFQHPKKIGSKYSLRIE